MHTWRKEMESFESLRSFLIIAKYSSKSRLPSPSRSCATNSEDRRSSSVLMYARKYAHTHKHKRVHKNKHAHKHALKHKDRSTSTHTNILHMSPLP